MTDLLLLTAQALLFLLAAWTLVELARRRDRARLDVVLVVMSLAVAAAPGAATGWLHVESEGLRLAAPLVGLLHPWLLLRLVSHFRAVAGWVHGLYLAGATAAGAGLLFAPPGWLTAAILCAWLVFALSLLHAGRSLGVGARHAQSVVRRRMGLLAAGACVVALVALAQGLGPLMGLSPAGLDPACAAAGLLAAVLYVLGLAPPPWLARAWQQTELQQFLRASTGAAGESTEQTLRRLLTTSQHAVGAQAAALARWDESRQRLELELRGERALVGGPLPADGLVARHWTFRRPFVADDGKEVRQACLRMAPGLDCNALVGVPLITPQRIWGLLIVFLRRGPVLPDEDLRLLSLLSEHTAVFLDYAALVEGLRREIADLRGEPVVEEPPLDES